MEIKYLFFLLIFLAGTYPYIQQAKSTDLDEDSPFPQMQYGTFEDYAFVLDGKIINHQALINYPGATLDKIFPFTLTLDDYEYDGALYFNTQDHFVSPVPYTDDPAWFINDTQVSSFDIRSSRPELYSRIRKSTQDTIINDKRYGGTVHVDTEEDFFAERISFSELVSMHADLPPERTIIHWRGVSQIYTGEDDVGTIIRDHFPIYHIDKRGLQKVEVEQIRFAEGERYIVNLLDNGYKWGARVTKWYGSNKARTIFKDPLAVDTTCPCYVVDFDTAGIDKRALRNLELMPEPYGGERVYLQKLSATMGLSTEKTNAYLTSDSLTVRFIVTKDGMLAGLETIEVDEVKYIPLLEAIKRNACTWSFGIVSGIRMKTNRKMTVIYNKDHDGNIRSLSALKFKYDMQ